MNYALFPSPVYALSSWLDFSNLLLISLLSLPCFSPFSPSPGLGFGGVAGEGPAPSLRKPPPPAPPAHPLWVIAICWKTRLGCWRNSSQFLEVKSGSLSWLSEPWAGARCNVSGILGGLVGTSSPWGSGWTPKQPPCSDDWVITQN